VAIPYGHGGDPDVVLSTHAAAEATDACQRHSKAAQRTGNGVHTLVKPASGGANDASLV
jgi:hypothetical protein